MLQSSVDREIQKTGFIGEAGAPADERPRPQTGEEQNDERWKCSEKQRSLILKIVEEHSLHKQQIENLAKDRFNVSVNRLQASGLIEELLERYPLKKNRVEAEQYRRPFRKGARR